MQTRKSRGQSQFAPLLQQNCSLKLALAKAKSKSPTIAEISAIVGDSEEHILECIELGKPDSFNILH
jgi:hypothetical protein